MTTLRELESDNDFLGRARKCRVVIQFELLSRSKLKHAYHPVHFYD